jgi:hypothetical protein
LSAVTHVDEWRRIRAAASAAQFAAMYPCAFLVSSTRSGTNDYTPLAKAVEFRTVTHEQPPAKQTASSDADERVVLALRKAPSNPFPDRISIGRARNCDVVIRDPSVSKLHGHFRDVLPESAVFTDAKSSNGTRVDGQPVEPGVAVKIERQSIVTLGRVQLVLLSATDVYDWL